MESLTQDKGKLINMGKINRYKAHSLSMHEGTHNRKLRSKSKDKGKAHETQTSKGTPNPSITPLDRKLKLKGCVQEVQGLFWHVRCNTKLKK